MSELQLLFVVLGALYVWECVSWLPRDSVAFSTATGNRWRTQNPASLLGNRRGGFVWASPFPPLGEIFCPQQLPFSLGPEGVLFFVSASVNPGWRSAQSGLFLNWEQISLLSLQGKKILLNQKLIVAASTVTRAQQLYRTLTDLAGKPANERAKMIKHLLSRTLDTKSIESRLQEFHRLVRPLRFLTNALFVLAFGIAPLLIWQIGLPLAWFGLLIGTLALTITSAIFFRRLHRTFYPSAEDDRFTLTLILALAPATTMRAHDIAARPLLENFHPLAVAKKLLPAAAFQRLARRFLLDLRHPALPICPNPQPQAHATEQFFRKTFQELVEAWLREHKIVPEELCAPPVMLEASCRAYCPRCEAQFTTPTGYCSDCGGLPLVAFTKAS